MELFESYLACIAVVLTAMCSTGRERSDGTHCWVAVSTEAFARETLAAANGKPDMDRVSQQLLQKLREALQSINPDLTPCQLEATFTAVQRWGSGFKAKCHPQPYIWDAELGVGATGDFCVTSSALQAISNGVALADAVSGRPSEAGKAAAAAPQSSKPGDVLRW